MVERLFLDSIDYGKRAEMGYLKREEGVRKTPA